MCLLLLSKITDYFLNACEIIHVTNNISVIFKAGQILTGFSLADI